MNKLFNIERIKTLTVVVLFFTTILLLYFLWGDKALNTNSLFNSNSSVKEFNQSDFLDMIKPSEVIVNFGTNSYTVITQKTEELLEKFITEFIDFSKSEDIFVVEIPAEQWDKVMNYRSIQFKFDYSVPFSQVSQAIGADKVQAFNAIDSMSIIGYSDVRAGSLFVYNGNEKNKKYYRIDSDIDSNVKDKDKGTDSIGSETTGDKGVNKIISDIEAEGYDQYYPMSAITGVQNNTLLPISQTSVPESSEQLQYKQEIKISDDEKTNKIAESFFGQSFDFIRKIKENDGTVIYMYSYGQKMLIINPSGSLEYKESVTGNSEEANFIDAFDQTLKFVSLHGGLNSLNGNNLNLYLKKANVISIDNQKRYRFTFGYQIDGYPVYYKQDEPVIVDIIGSQVVYYKRYILDLENEKLNEMTMDDTKQEIISILNVLTQNCKEMSELLLKSGVEVEGNDVDTIFSSVSKKITGVRLGYFASGQKDKFLPVWIVFTDKCNFYFDTSTGELTGYTVNK